MIRVARSTVAGVLFALVTSSVMAATYVVPSDRDMVRRADAIVIATASSSRPQLNARGSVETVTSLSIEQVLKGAFIQSSVDIHEPGGIYGDRAVLIPGVPHFEPGERLLLFLSRTPNGGWAVSDLALGRFNFATDRAGQQLVVRAEADVVGWDPDLTPHKEVRRSAEKFVAFIRAEVAAGRGNEDYLVPEHPLASYSTESVSPLSTSANSTPSFGVQSDAFTVASNATYTPMSYTYSFDNTNTGMGGRWTVFPQAVNYYKGATDEPGAPSGGVTAIQTALGSWTNDPGSNVNLAYAGVDTTHTGGVGTADGRNTILFERSLAAYGAAPFTCSGSGYSGTLGLGGITNATGTHSFAGQTWYTAQEGDVEMNQGIANCTLLFNNGDFNTAVTHEVGHTLGFRHSDQTRADNPGVPCSSDPNLECASVAVMKSFVPGGINATLQTWDINAVRAVYPGTTVVRRVREDFNADGVSDIFWRHSNGSNATWFNNSSALASPTVTLQTSVTDTNWRPLMFGDFDNNGSGDIFWRHATAGATAIWYFSAGTLTSMPLSLGVADLNWQPKLVGDFNGDGSSDMLWRHVVNGANVIWFMHPNSANPNVVFTIGDGDPAWEPVAAGDFDADGKTDVFWRHSSGLNAVWLMSATTGDSPSPSVAYTTSVAPGAGWTVIGAGDTTGDGKADVIWRNLSTGTVTVWTMSGATKVTERTMGTATLDWQIVAIGDYNRDGITDLFWRNSSTGATSYWLTNASTGTPTIVAGRGEGDLGWQPYGTK